MFCFNLFNRGKNARSESLDESSSGSLSPSGSTQEMLNMISDLQSQRIDSQRAELPPITKQPISAKAMSLLGLLPVDIGMCEDDFIDIARVQSSTRLDKQRSEPPRPRSALAAPLATEEDFFNYFILSQVGRVENPRAGTPLVQASQKKPKKSKNGK